MWNLQFCVLLRSVQRKSLGSNILCYGRLLTVLITTTFAIQECRKTKILREKIILQNGFDTSKAKQNIFALKILVCDEISYIGFISYFSKWFIQYKITDWPKRLNKIENFLAVSRSCIDSDFMTMQREHLRYALGFH